MLNFLLLGSLHSRRLEVVGARKNGAREGETRVSRASPFFSCAHYFQAPATQVSFLVLCKLLLVPKLQNKRKFLSTQGLLRHLMS